MLLCRLFVQDICWQRYVTLAVRCPLASQASEKSPRKHRARLRLSFEETISSPVCPQRRRQTQVVLLWQPPASFLKAIIL